MLTIISFLLTLVGAVNWLFIGLLQYDFIAGIFGFQASVFSRLIYIVFGLSGIVLLFKMFKGKGTIAVFSRRNKKDLQKNLDKINEGQLQESRVNVEASKEHFSRHNIHDKNDDFENEFNNKEFNEDFGEFDDFPPRKESQSGLFDEHLDK